MVLHAPAKVRTVTLTIDGTEVTVPEGTTIWTAAQGAGIDIPVLCHDERYDPVGCLPHVRGGRRGARLRRRLRAAVRGRHDVKTATDDVERNRATLTELLLADQPAR